MMVVLENPAITTLNTAYLPAIKDNNELLRDMILYYESQIWSKTDPGQRIENYLVSEIWNLFFFYLRDFSLSWSFITKKGD